MLTLRCVSDLQIKGLRFRALIKLNVLGSFLFEDVIFHGYVGRVERNTICHETY